MLALLCKIHGLPDQLVLEHTAPPTPGPGQVRIAVYACGANFPDTLMIQNKYQFKPPLPFSPGGEVAGVVEEVGEGVRTVQVGQRVFALSGWGGMAEQTVVDAARCVPLPDAMTFGDGAAFLYNHATSYHALKDRAALQPGETLLVLGAGGGVGLAAVELGKLLGATVIAAASSDEKLAVCRQKGADQLINYQTDDLRERLKQLTGGRGVDVVFDPVGDAFTEPALRSVGWQGRYLIVGFAAGQIPRLPMNLALLKGCAIVGVFWGAFVQHEPARAYQNNLDLTRHFVEGRLRPHIHQTYSLADAPRALADIMARKVIGKAVILVRK